jgi:hypothetical protein
LAYTKAENIFTAFPRRQTDALGLWQTGIYFSRKMENFSSTNIDPFLITQKNPKKFYKVIGFFMRICYTLVMKIGNFVMM